MSAILARGDLPEIVVRFLKHEQGRMGVSLTSLEHLESEQFEESSEEHREKVVSDVTEVHDVDLPRISQAAEDPVNKVRGLTGPAHAPGRCGRTTLNLNYRPEQRVLRVSPDARNQWGDVAVVEGVPFQAEAPLL